MELRKPYTNRQPDVTEFYKPQARGVRSWAPGRNKSENRLFFTSSLVGDLLYQQRLAVSMGPLDSHGF